MARRKPTKPDRTTSKLLTQIRRGDYNSVGVLADWLEENQLPYAKRVRAMWLRTAERAVYWNAYDFSKSRRWTRWEVLAGDRRGTCRKVLRIYDRVWAPGKVPTLKTFL